MLSLGCLSMLKEKITQNVKCVSTGRSCLSLLLIAGYLFCYCERQVQNVDK